MRRTTLALGLLAVAGLGAAAPPAQADQFKRWRSPTGNVRCAYDTVRVRLACSTLSSDGLDAYLLYPAGEPRRGTTSFHVPASAYHVLRYGHQVRWGRLVLSSRLSGMEGSNGRHGFQLARNWARSW